MPDDLKDQQAPAGGGHDAAAKEHEIALSINSFKAQYVSQSDKQGDYAERTFIWTRRAAVGVFVYTALTFGLAIIGLCQLWTSRDTMINQQRAWIDAPKITYEKVGDQIQFKYAFKNFGHSPTRGLHINGKFIPSAKTERDWHTQVDAYCAEGKQIVVKKSTGYSSAAIIPDASYDGPFSPGLHGGDTKEITDNPVLVGCASYGQSLDGADVNTTGFHAIIRLSEMPPGSVIPVEAIAPD